MKIPGKIIFKAIVGSQAYGTNLPTSDIDIKGVYVQDQDDIYGFGYQSDVIINKDECYYEVKKFIELLKKGNPTILELLFSPIDCVLINEPEFQLLVNQRDKFLTTECFKSFAGYAIDQVTKAKGLNKKMNWEKTKVERRTPIDFCYFYENGKTYPITKFLERNSYEQKDCGLVRLDHFNNCYALYHNHGDVTLGYRGLVFENSNELRLTSTKKEAIAECILFYNKDGYSMHCKDYNEYQEWLRNRNTQRYIDIDNHNQKIDGKNMLHCRRLIETAIEIGEQKTINVRRSNAADLIKIRKGEVDLDTLLQRATMDIERIKELEKTSDLPKSVDSDFCDYLLIKIRKMVYKKQGLMKRIENFFLLLTVVSNDYKK